MVNPFFNDRERRPRACWRLLFQVGAFLIGANVLGGVALVALALFGGAAALGGTIEDLALSPSILVANWVASLVAALLSVWLAARFFDRRPLSGFGLHIAREWWLDLGFGLSLGALLMAGIFLFQLAAGWVAVTGAFEATTEVAPFFPAILAPLVAFVCVGVYEELMFRGYQLKNMAEGLNLPSVGPRGAVILAWAISSTLFGIVHLLNPNASFVSTLGIIFAGLLLGIGYVLTGRLAIPIGLHTTWNFFQGNVFGFPVSGIEPLGATFLSIEQGGPPLVTGGVFGPEAGLLGLAATVVGSLLVLLWVRIRSGKVAIETSLAEPPLATTDHSQSPGCGGQAGAPNTRP